MSSKGGRENIENKTNMEVQLINEELLKELYDKATVNGRLRQNFDMRTSAEDGSQRVHPR